MTWLHYIRGRWAHARAERAIRRFCRLRAVAEKNFARCGLDRDGNVPAPDADKGPDDGANPDIARRDAGVQVMW